MEPVYHEGGGAAEWIFYVIFFFTAQVVIVLFILTIQSIFEKISPDLRSLSVTQLWLTIIPAFGSIWIFYVIYQLAESLSEEFKRRQIVEFETKPGLGVGWAFSFFAVTALLTMMIDERIITILLYVTAVVLFVIYWAKLAGFKTQLTSEATSPFQPAQHFPQQPFYPPQESFPPVQQPQQWQQPPPPGYYNPENQPPKQDEWEKWKPK